MCSDLFIFFNQSVISDKSNPNKSLYNIRF